MIRMIAGVACAVLTVAYANAAVDTTPERTVDIDCAAVRAFVAEKGVDAMDDLARAQGVSQKAVALIKRRCLR